MEQDDAPLRAVISRSRLEDIDKMREALVDSINRVASVVGIVPEEAIAGRLLLVLDVLFHSVREDHVVDPLEGVSRHPRTLLNELEIVFKRPFPIQLLVFLRVLQARDRA